MKKNCCISVIFIFCFICTGCFFLWCELGEESHSLSGTSEILISPQQEKYNINDETFLTIKYSSTKQVYNKISLKSYAELYDPIREKYIPTDNIILCSENSETNLIDENYVLSKYDEFPNQDIEKKLLIQASTLGNYRISIYLLGYRSDSDIADYNSKYFYLNFNKNQLDATTLNIESKPRLNTLY